MDQHRRGELVFDGIDQGPADGSVVVLLHGSPQSNACWDGVIQRLTADGYRCLAPNQRAYSRGARPPRRRDYRVSELVQDVRALIDASGARTVHLVGHDWGARLAWAVAGAIPERLASLTTVSVPHAAAFLSRPSGRQVVAGWYACFFSLPRITERLLHSEGDASGLSKLMQRFGQPREAADRDALVMAQPGTLTAALNWYRANWVSLLREARISITVPTMYIWSDGDTAVLGKAARNCGRHVSGEYRFEILQGSHWLLDEQPGTLAALLSEWLAAHPSITSA